MTNTITILALIALTGISVPSAFACTPQDTIVWDDVFWVASIQPLMHNTEPIAEFGHVAISFAFPHVVSNESTEQAVVDQLNNAGYFVDDGSIRPVTVSDIEVIVPGIGSFFSSTCANGLSQMIGGMLLQPDAMTLALAYGIVNSIWMAPLAIGIGAGIYLTKNKLKR